MNAPLDPTRLLAAALVLLAYLALCLLLCWRHHRRQRPAAGPDTPWQVVFASQTGSAEALALNTAKALEMAGLPVQCRPLNALSADQLQAGGHYLLLLSTCGDGDAPDNAARFARNLLTRSLNLSRVSFGLLALGDRDYPAYCGFGRRVAQWLGAQGGRALFAPIEVHRNDPHALAAWQQQVSHLAQLGDAPSWALPPFRPWQLRERVLLNPGSQGGAVFLLSLTPPAGPWPDWQAGDLAQLALPDEGDCVRDYSIACLPVHGALQLLLRLHRHPDGQLGRMSGWLAEQLPIGGIVPLRVRAQHRFRQGDHTGRAMILIGNGVGVAGLRAHLQARIQAGCGPNWLVFGERQQACDNFFATEFDRWLADGQLQRLDRCFSRDAGGGYVQHALLAAADELRSWVADGAVIYLCGSRLGMAEAVDQVLRGVLGEADHAVLVQEGRYRRDVF